MQLSQEKTKIHSVQFYTIILLTGIAAIILVSINYYEDGNIQNLTSFDNRNIPVVSPFPIEVNQTTGWLIYNEHFDSIYSERYFRFRYPSVLELQDGFSSPVKLFWDSRFGMEIEYFPYLDARENEKTEETFRRFYEMWIGLKTKRYKGKLPEALEGLEKITLDSDVVFYRLVETPENYIFRLVDSPSMTYIGLVEGNGVLVGVSRALPEEIVFEILNSLSFEQNSEQ